MEQLPKMVEKKVIWSSGAAVLLTALVFLGAGQLTDEKNYGCEARGLIMPCDSLSPYYGMPNGKCINAVLGNKLCQSGWTKDVVFEIEDEQTKPAAEDCAPKVVGIAYTNTGKYYCDCIGAGCPCRSTEEILSVLG